MPPQIPTQQNKKCDDCKTYCDEHKLVLMQLENIKNIPNNVSRLSGTLAVLGVLIIAAVGIIFNAHIESKKTAEMYSNKLDALSTQISKLENDTTKSILSLKSDITKMNSSIEQIQRDTGRRTPQDKDRN